MQGGPSPSGGCRMVVNRAHRFTQMLCAFLLLVLVLLLILVGKLLEKVSHSLDAHVILGKQLKEPESSEHLLHKMHMRLHHSVLLTPLSRRCSCAVCVSVTVVFGPQGPSS